MSKGCGCQTGMFKWFKPPYAELFRAACELHDDAYDAGGRDVVRHAADRDLFDNMARRIWQTDRRPLHLWWLTCIALAYYIAVRIFGRFYFNYADN